VQHDDILTAFVCIIIIIGFRSKMSWERGDDVARCGGDGGFTQKSKIIPKGEEEDSLKQFRNFPKPFLSALIKFVQSKPIIYENKTIWKRWCSNTLSALSPLHTHSGLSTLGGVGGERQIRGWRGCKANIFERRLRRR